MGGVAGHFWRHFEVSLAAQRRGIPVFTDGVDVLIRDSISRAVAWYRDLLEGVHLKKRTVD